MKLTRKRIYEILDTLRENDKVSAGYDFLMIATILLSIVPLTFKESNLFFEIIDKLTVSVFIIDYILRIATADFKLRRGALSFLLYPFTFMALVDLVSILSSFNVVAAGMKTLKLFRLVRAFRAFRVVKAFKVLRYSKSIGVIVNVMKEQREPLIAVGSLAIGYILIAALIIFNVEPDTFNNYFDAIYWATISLTTMGYGDIYPVTTAGRVVTMVSSFVGIAIVALPSGIITAGYMSELRRLNGAEESAQPTVLGTKPGSYPTDM